MLIFKIMKQVLPSQRKYYSAQTGNKATVVSQPKMFLVRYHDKENNVIENMGPYEHPEEADKALKSYLRQGICSWLVSYND